MKPSPPPSTSPSTSSPSPPPKNNINQILYPQNFLVQSFEKSFKENESNNNNFDKRFYFIINGKFPVYINKKTIEILQNKIDKITNDIKVIVHKYRKTKYLFSILVSTSSQSDRVSAISLLKLSNNSVSIIDPSDGNSIMLKLSSSPSLKSLRAHFQGSNDVAIFPFEYSLIGIVKFKNFVSYNQSLIKKGPIITDDNSHCRYDTINQFNDENINF